MTEFDHEKLDVYRVALEFVVAASDIAEKFLNGRHNLADQLDRASSSVVLNIAEGAGEFSPAEKARFYRMAKRSATECAAALDVCKARKWADAPSLEAGREMLLRIVSMLIRMIHTVEAARDRKSGESPERSIAPPKPR